VVKADMVMAKAPSMGTFERYLTLWVAICIVAGVALGQLVPGLFRALGAATVAEVNLPVAVLVWLMIVPMLLKIDLAALGQVREHWRGIAVTVGVNWLVKPFSMALLGWLFVGYLFRPLLPAGQIDAYIAGLILLAAAPCTAMVFVWSNLVEGEPHFTLSQVALNDTIMVVAFAPIVALLLGLSSITVPWNTLLLSVVLYIVVPVIVAQFWRHMLLAKGGQAALARSLRALAPLSLSALLLTLVLLVRPARRTDHATAARHCALGGADPETGLFQRRAGLLAEPPLSRRMVHCRAFGADRSQQLLRTGRGDGNCSFRLSIGRGAFNRRRRAGRSAGDAVRRPDRQPKQGLVRARCSGCVS
jgi:arsenical-resistance protein